MKISKVIVVINEGKEHARVTARTLKEVLDAANVKQEWVAAIPPA